MDFANKSNEDLQNFFQKILKRIPGLQSIIVADRDGVPLLTVGDNSTADVTLPVTFAAATEQANKCNLGRCRSMVTFFENRTVVYLNHPPLVIVLFADSEANFNCGLLLGLADELRAALEPLRISVKKIASEINN
jgi:hypothetical protein